ncbi:hypothetical protein CLPU_17c00010 [Gottschalkia purinilytica]|uniref:Helix-turn-helix domain-containing protein n=1 Tax=Gottschalkia purinilytica TaxID=1503 RepID=A0A0L0W7C2_GOTPU|nr:helix-turn-helix domain-containing protein [Gottschalkia purinilytica]KNF07376.1 hypothetical protein CLPU_17c00010 [Gottschalkia purinilytica]
MDKETLYKIVHGQHSDPVKALAELYFKGAITLEDISIRLTLPPVLRFDAWRYIAQNEMITAQEAGELWGLSESTLRKVFFNIENGKSNKFKENEYRKSGKVWLVKRSAMYREYGEPKVKE